MCVSFKKFATVETASEDFLHYGCNARVVQDMGPAKIKRRACVCSETQNTPVTCWKLRGAPG